MSDWRANCHGMDNIMVNYFETIQSNAYGLIPVRQKGCSNAWNIPQTAQNLLSIIEGFEHLTSSFPLLANILRLLEGVN